MAKKRKKLAERIEVNGQVYRLVVALIHTKKADGRPALIKLMYDEDTIELAGGEHFCTMYLPLLEWRQLKDAGMVHIPPSK